MQADNFCCIFSDLFSDAFRVHDASTLVPPMRLYCRLLPPRQIARLFKGKWMIGRGGGDRKHYQADFQGLGRNVGER
jgi:hypothetical protein